MKGYVLNRPSTRIKMAWMHEHYAELKTKAIWEITEEMFRVGLYSPKTSKGDAGFHVAKFWGKVCLDRANSGLR